MESVGTETTLGKKANQILKYLNCNIGLYRVVEVQYFQGEGHIEIVTYEKSPSGNYSKVSNKCLKLSLMLYRVLTDNLETIVQHFQILKDGGKTNYRLHLGEQIFLRIDPDIRCVDIRKHFIPTGSVSSEKNLRPGIPGVGMRLGEFENFLDLIEQLSDLSQIHTVIPCSEKEDHKIIEVLQNCKICNPHQIFF